MLIFFVFYIKKRYHKITFVLMLRDDLFLYSYEIAAYFITEEIVISILKRAIYSYFILNINTIYEIEGFNGNSVSVL